MATELEPEPEPEPDSDSEPLYFSVAVIGSSGGGTATLGHTDSIELLTTIHQELLRIGDVDVDDQECHKGCQRTRKRQRRVCIGISHAIFVSLCDGSGFDSVQKKDWLPDNNDDGNGIKEGDDGGDGGPTAALYSVGFHECDAANTDRLYGQQRHIFRVKFVEEGPLSKINRLAQTFDVTLGDAITRCHHTPNKNNDKSSNYQISAIISLSSEPTTIHSTSLGACQTCNNQLGINDFDIPIAGSGGTSLSQIASLYDLRIVGNSGGSVASTTLTKARGWAMGLADEWGMVYDANRSCESTEGSGPAGGEEDGVDTTADTQTKDVSRSSTPIPTLKSILEAALPTFLFVCISLRLMNTWGTWGRSDDEEETTCIWDNSGEHNNEQFTPMSIVTFALQHIVIGTTCCITAATSRSSSSSASGSNDSSGDQSTLLMSATIAGALASASASQSSVTPSSIGGGGALAGLVAGAFLPFVLAKVSNLCFRHHVTATMTNILCGGGVGMFVGLFMHLSGVAQLLSLLTGMIRSMLRWTRFVLPEDGGRIPMPWLVGFIFQILRDFQRLWTISFSRLPFVPYESPILQVQGWQCGSQPMPVPIGLGFLHGCIFVYGSKVGWYHSLFLPAILLEMDSAPIGQEASLFGAIDECTLVMVCAGICVGNLVLPPSSTKQKNQAREKGKGGMASLSWQALKTNILCGDFIEAAYPSMERSAIINGFAYVAAGLSTEILLQRRVLSTAYMPLFVAIWLSNDRWGMGSACFVAFVVSLCGTLVANAISIRKP